MRKSRRLIATGVILLILGFAVWLILPHGPEIDPIRHGRRLSEWILEYENNRFQATNEASNEASIVLDEEGTNALPLLLQMLQAHDTPLASNYYRIIQKQHLITVRHQEPYLLNRAAALAFQRLRWQQDVCYSFIPELVRIHDRQYSPSSMLNVSLAFAALGPSANAAVPSLLKQTTNSNGEVRVGAIFALGKIHANPEQVIPVLVAKLKISTEEFYGELSEVELALGQYGAEARAAVPYLISIIRATRTKSASPISVYIRDIDMSGAVILNPDFNTLQLIDPVAASNLLQEVPVKP